MTRTTDADVARRRRKSGAARRDEIADAALRILAARGGREFTARALARQVGITDAGVFRHFAGMDAIVDAVVERMEAVLFAGFPPRDPDAIARLGVFYRHRTRALLEHPHLSRLLLTDHLEQVAGPAAARRVAAFRRRTQGFVLDCLREARRQGRLRGVADPQVAAVLVSGAILALGRRSARGKHDRATKKLSQDVWPVLETLLRGAGHHRKAMGRDG